MDFIVPATQRLESYCSAIGQRLGLGLEGFVVETSRGTAVKVFGRPPACRRERDVYRRLTERQVVSIQGHAVPQLLGYDDELGVIEMSIVAPPFVLDFGKARLDTSWEEAFRDAPHVVVERWAHWESLFEPEQWPMVLAIYGELGRRYGVWLEDLHPGNIAFAPESA